MLRFIAGKLEVFIRKIGSMLAMQKKFFEYPGAQEYLPPPDGSNKTYLEPPKWLRADEWFDM